MSPRPHPRADRTVSLASILIALALSGPAIGDEVLYLPAGSTWRYLPGLEEASAPDPAAWREPGFADDAWPEGAAPVGYGEDDPGTDLSLTDPPMRGSYTSVFLRARFEVPRIDEVEALEASIAYDDAVVVWINGTEVLRLNMRSEPGDPVAYDDTARLGREGTEFDPHSLDSPRTWLREGTNTIAVQLLNSSPNGSDAWFDLQLVDPLGPDRTAPGIRSVVPADGTRVRALSRIEVTFDEEVAGIDAADLLVDGVPAASLTGQGAGPWTFRFPSPAPGEISLAWSDDHGITDRSPAANPLPPASWTYVLDPDAEPPDVVISELVADNRSGPLDEDREYPDWIEIHNRSDETVDLGGWSLSDDADDPGRWVFPTLRVGADERAIVFASAKDRREEGAELHTSFRLEISGEYLGLFSGELPRRPIHEYAPGYPEQRAGYSYGLTEEGEPRHFGSPTPGEPNADATSVPGFALPPRFSVPHGHYDGPFTLELSTDTPGGTVLYTLDGSEPEPGGAALYEEPILVEGSRDRPAVVVRAVAARDDLDPSRSVTRTYIFPHEVLSQADRPAGMPTRWGSAPSVDYGMDPQIVTPEGQAERILDGLLSLPSLCITSDVADMFGPGGIYSNPQSEGDRWERPGSVELIWPEGLDPDGEGGFQENCGLRIHGGASRQPEKSPKHSFRMYFRAIYGPTRLRYPVFPDSHVEDFDVLVARAGFNNSWIHWDGGQRSRAQFIRDQWARDVQLAMGDVASHGRFVHLYVSGLYWGVYNLVERPNAPFAASYLGGEKEEYDAYSSGSLTDGNATSWNETLALARSGSLSDPDRYRQLADLLDLPAFADYMMVNFYGANADWPHHNWYAARRRTPDGRWRFFSWDAERILEGLTANRTGVSDDLSPGIIYARLRTTDEFQTLFGDRAHLHLGEGGPLSPEESARLWVLRMQELEPAVVCESARWGDYRRDVHSWSSGPYELYTVETHWNRERDRLIASYFPRRTPTVLNQLRSLGLYPRVEAPILLPDPGEVEIGEALEIAAPEGQEGTIWYTLDGTDPRVAFTGDVDPSARTVAGPIVIDDHASVRARILDPEGRWSALASGEYPIASALAGLRISEIHYHPASGAGAEFVELTNRSDRTLSLDGVRFTSGVTFAFGPGSLLGPGESTVVTDDVARFTASYPDVTPAGAWTGRLDNGGERLRLEDARGGQLESFSWDDDGLWPIGPDGFGPSLVRVDPEADPDDPRSWRPSAEPGGSPGREDPPRPAEAVVISEVLADATAPRESAVELHNLEGRPVDIGGWFLSSSRADVLALQAWRIPPGTTLAPGARWVVYAVDLAGELALDPAEGAVYLSAADPDGLLTGYIVETAYAVAGPDISAGRVETSVGPRLAALGQVSLGVDEPGSVEEFRSGEGAPNGDALAGEVVIHEVMYHPEDGHVEFIELANRGPDSIALRDPDSGFGWRLRGVSDPSGDGPFSFPAGAEIASGGLLVLVPVDPDFFREAYAVPADVPIVGPYAGSLDNGGERLTLERPRLRGDSTVAWIPVDRVRYDDEGAWPEAADGDGFSLERIRADVYGDEPLHWDASTTRDGTPGRANSVGLPAGAEPPRARPRADPAEGDAPLEVTFDAGDSSDGDGSIVSTEWIFDDGLRAEGRSVRRTFDVPGARTALLRVTDDSGATDTRAIEVTVREPPDGGRQVPSDLNQDGALNISDAVALLGHLFQGTPARLPCEGGTIEDAGNRMLLDADGSGGVNLTDAVHILLYLFRGGPPPFAGEACLEIPGCPDVCAP